MKYFASFLVICCFLKSFYYATFELKVKKNKLGAIGVYILSFIGLIFPITIMFIFY